MDSYQFAEYPVADANDSRRINCVGFDISSNMTDTAFAAQGIQKCQCARNDNTQRLIARFVGKLNQLSAFVWQIGNVLAEGNARPGECLLKEPEHRFHELTGTQPRRIIFCVEQCFGISLLDFPIFLDNPISDLFRNTGKSLFKRRISLYIQIGFGHSFPF